MRLALTCLVVAAVSIPNVAPASAGELPSDEALNAMIDAACGDYLGEEAFLRLPPAERTADVACRMRAIATELSARLPRDNKASGVTGVSADGTVLVFHVKVPARRENVRESKVQAARDLVEASLCATREMQSVVRMGGSFRYLMRDEADEPLGEFTVEHC
jgi:hypothetical protein